MLNNWLTCTFQFVLDKPGKPEGPLKISDIHKEGCTLKWNPPEDDGGVPIEYYQVEKMDTETGIIGLRCLSKFKINNGETFSMSNF